MNCATRIAAWLLVGTFAARAANAQAVLSDDFNDNATDLDRWSIGTAGSGVTLFENNQRLEIAFSLNASGSFLAKQYNSRCRLRGDFDIQVDFQLIDWPNSNGVRVGLSVAGPAGNFLVERVSFGHPLVDFPGQPREVYLIDASSAGVQGITGTGNLSGKLRMVRAGATATGYYFSSGGWVPIASAFLGTADVNFILNSFTADNLFTDQAVKLAYDNFFVNAGQLVCRPVARCRNVTVSASSNCTADATIDNGSFDPDGDPITITQSPAGPYALGNTEVTLTVADASGASAQCTATVTVEVPAGAVAGHILAECPSPGTPLLGVKVDVFDGEGMLVASTVTDDAGAFTVPGLASQETYTVTLVTPLGYVAAAEEIHAAIDCGETEPAEFSLSCVPIVANPRPSGFWKHQIGVATGGPGSAQVDGPALCSLLDLISAHFNSNAINEVVVYQPPASDTCEDKLQVAKTLLNLRGNVGMTARAQQQLMALLLNVAAGNIGLQQVVSADGATLSQAITYCDNLIDGPLAGHETAKTIADLVNNNQQVGAGVIPLTTQNIAYKTDHLVTEFLGAGPSPTRGPMTVRFNLARPEEVSVRVYSAAGRMVHELAAGSLSPGRAVLVWDGTDRHGNTVPAGVYFVRAEIAGQRHTQRVVRLR